MYPLFSVVQQYAEVFHPKIKQNQFHEILVFQVALHLLHLRIGYFKTSERIINGYYLILYQMITSYILKSHALCIYLYTAKKIENVHKKFIATSDFISNQHIERHMFSK